MTQPVKALQAKTKGDFASFEQTIIHRRELRQDDVAIEIKYCGVCHSDVSMVQWQGAHFPMVPGHEISGLVTAVGSNVKDFKPGDRVGVGCFVNSCGKCAECKLAVNSSVKRAPSLYLIQKMMTAPLRKVVIHKQSLLRIALYCILPMNYHWRMRLHYYVPGSRLIIQ